MFKLKGYLFIPCVTALSLASALASLKSLHMFQLNSYKTSAHLRWIRINIAKFYTQIIFLALLALCPFVDALFLQLIFLASALVFCLLNKPLKNAKKPLVYTSRVKRMLAVSALLLAGAAALALFSGETFRLAVFGLIYVLSPLIPIAANAINMPVEASIRRYYISDAKKILKSCPNLIVIGITGSYGKTSVKYYLTTLLKAKYNVLMTPESFNTPMGIVKTIRGQLRSTHDIFVCEMGARRRGDIKELCGIVSPQHGIITSIGEQHLESFKTAETIIKTKFELAEAVSGRGFIFLNGDNAFIRANMPAQNLKTYGLGKNNNYYAHDIRVTPEGTTFSFSDNGVEIKDLQTRLIGEHNVVNLAGAMALCSYLGVAYEDMRAQLKKIAPPPHRLQLTKSNGMVIIDDSYNSNPNGCDAALKTLSMFDGYRILITPGMVELGAKQYECNYTFGTQAAGACDFVILVGAKQSKAIYNGLIDANYNASNIFVADKFSEAIQKAYGITSDKQKIILLENDLPDNY